MTTTDNAQTIVDTALASATPSTITDNLRTVVVPDGGDLRLIDIRDHGDTPRRKKGTVKVDDADSFNAYVKKHELSQTELWADLVNTRVIAVINAHMGTTGDGIEDYAGYGDHRAVLGVRKTDSWNAWIARDRKPMSQQEFAEHIEDRAIDIANPSSADVLELAQHFQASMGGEFESSKRLSNGEAQLVYKESIAAKAGQRGQLDIPAFIELGLQPFDGAPTYKVTARFRYRLDHGRLLMSYALERPDDVLRNAFLDVVTLVEDDLDRKVYRGTPE